MNRIVVIALAMSFAIPSLAEPGHGRNYTSSATKKEKPNLKVEYNVQYNYVEADFKVENTQQWAAMMQAYPGQELFKRLKGLPGIEQIEFLPGKHTIDSDFYDKEVVASERDSILMVRVKGTAPFSLMFKVNEKLRRCLDNPLAKGAEEKDMSQWGAPDWSPSLINKEAPCKRFSGLVVTGPVAVYGTLPATYGSHLSLLNQIKFEWELRSDYSKKHTELNSRFEITRQDFPKALSHLIQWTYGSRIPFAEVFLQDPQRNALIQIGRVLKMKNMEILRGEQ